MPSCLNHSTRSSVSLPALHGITNSVGPPGETEQRREAVEGYPIPPWFISFLPLWRPSKLLGGKWDERRNWQKGRFTADKSSASPQLRPPVHVLLLSYIQSSVRYSVPTVDKVTGLPLTWGDPGRRGWEWAVERGCKELAD